MQRTVPHTASRSISLFMRTYYSLLRTTDAVQIHSLEESYLAMESSLHVHARDSHPDVSTLVYSCLRLPFCIQDVNMILMGQTEDVFEKHGITLKDWEPVHSVGRRRRMLWDKKDTLAVFISSRSDIDDLIPMLVAYQYEWNKIHELLSMSGQQGWLKALEKDVNPEQWDKLNDALGIPEEELMRLRLALKAYFVPMLKDISTRRKSFRLRQLAGSLSEYRRATGRWWANVRESMPDSDYALEDKPVYFVSSNMHCLSNTLSGYAIRERERLLEFLHESAQHDLLMEYEDMQRDDALADNEPNFLYYALKKYIDARGKEAREQILQAENEIALQKVPSKRGFDVAAQVIPIHKLRADYLDPRISSAEECNFSLLQQSDALIMNIDYPLGMAAYELLSHVSSRVGKLMGVYIMGKAATLNGRVGDVMVPAVVHDEHSQNTYLYTNCFDASHVSPYMTLGSVLDNQKAITAFGTYLQNPQYMDIFYEEGYTILEMEASPYLSAIYESVRPRRHPSDQVVRLYETSLDVGILHYASDTPFSRGHNLGAGSLGYHGVEPTYASAIAILRRIFTGETRRLMVKHYQREN